jgi:hypothetical protein
MLRYTERQFATKRSQTGKAHRGREPNPTTELALIRRHPTRPDPTRPALHGKATKTHPEQKKPEKETEENISAEPILGGAAAEEDGRGRVDFDRDGGGGSAQPFLARRGGRVGGGGAGAHLRLLPQGDPRRAGEDARRGRAPRDGALRGRGRARRPLPLPLLLVQAPLRRRGRGTYGRSPLHVRVRPI